MYDMIMINDNMISTIIFMLLLIISSVDRTTIIEKFDVRIGQGLWSTRWNVLNFFIIILFL